MSSKNGGVFTDSNMLMGATLELVTVAFLAFNFLFQLNQILFIFPLNFEPLFVVLLQTFLKKSCFLYFLI